MSGMIGVQTPSGAGGDQKETRATGTNVNHRPPMPDPATLPRQPFRPALEVKNFSSLSGPTSNAKVDNSGIFYVEEDFTAQQKRVESMQLANPAKAKKLFQSYTKMVVLSSAADLQAVLGLMASTGAGPPPAWFAVKMFQAGVMALNLEVPKFMVQNGFNPRMGPLRTIMFDLLKGNAKEREVGEGKASKKEQVARDRRYVEAMLFLAVECELDVTTCRSGDFMTLLHVAAQSDLALMVLTLIELGVDVNGVAKDDSTPLGAAVFGEGGKDGKSAVLLRRRGARLDWRTPKGGGTAGRGGLSKDDNALAGKFKETLVVGSSEGFARKTGFGGAGLKEEEEEEEEEIDMGLTFSCGE